MTVFFLTACTSWGQNVGTDREQTSTPKTSTDKNIPARVSPMTAAATQRGIEQCAARVEQMSGVLGFGPRSKGMLLAPVDPADRMLFSMMVAQPVNAELFGLIGLDFAPNQANGCGASMQAVAYWSQSCDSLIEGPMAKLKKLDVLQTDITVLESGPTSKVYLLKAGVNGCVSVKKEIIF